ncbi:MAG TPA: DUF1349 domain-containing protein [Opitutales bacterium]|nr:DUF1349 domain-containing protein [Opitutales bacterium]
MTNTPFEAFPASLVWKNTPVHTELLGSRSLSITAAGHTDWFIDPLDRAWNKDDAPVALFTPPDGEFVFSAKIRVAFASTFDAGVIQLREKTDLWGKLCFEYSPQNKPMIVSVVTRGKSDDCNSTIIDGNEVYLRVAVRPEVVAFHYSTDGAFWHMVRYFTLGRHEHLSVGLSAQSPCGPGCEVLFSEISYRAGIIRDHRSGE